MPTVRPSPAGDLGSGPSLTGATSRADQLAGAVERRIRDQELPAGSPLGTIEDLQSASGFSRPTVSEAVRMLRDRGVVRIKPGRGGGLFVAERGPVVRLRHTLLSVSDEPATVAEAIELRDHLELLIDLGAARCRTEGDVADLRRLLAELAGAEDWADFMRANWALHERIALICPNSMARAVYIGTLGHLSGTAAYAHDPDDPDAASYRAERLRIHTDLVDAIASGQEDRVREAVAHHHAESAEMSPESSVSSLETPGATP